MADFQEGTGSEGGNGGGSGATTLAGLTDVAGDTPQAGEVLVRGATSWGPGLVSSAGIAEGTILGGDLNIASVMGSIAASDDDARAGTRVDRGMTPAATHAAIEYARTSDIPEASLTGLELVGSGAIDAVNEMKLNSGNLLNIRLAVASYQTLKPLLHKNNTVEFIATDGTVELSTTMDRATEFDESEATDDLVINLDGISPLTLSSNFTNLTLRIRASWADDFGFATQAEAEAQTLTDVIMSPGRVKDWWTARNKSRVWEASDGFTQASSGSDIGESRFWFASGGGGSKAGKLRGGSLGDTNGLRAGLAYQSVLWFTNGNEWIWAQVSVVATEANGSTGGGASAANKEFSFTVGEHYASSGAASATGRWKLEIFSEVASSKRGDTAPRILLPNSIDPGSASEGQVLGVTGGLVGFIEDRHTIEASKSFTAVTSEGVADSTSYGYYASNTSKVTTDANSTSDLVLTPRTTTDKVDLMWNAVGEFLVTGGNRGQDAQIQRKIGSGTWTEIFQKDYAMWAGGRGNPVQLITYTDTPNTTEEVRYRIRFKARTEDDGGNKGLRVGGVRFQAKLLAG